MRKITIEKIFAKVEQNIIDFRTLSPKAINSWGKPSKNDH